MSTPKSNQAPLGQVHVEETSLHLLKMNDFIAKNIRDRMAANNTLVVNICSSPGSGKTSLLQATAQRLKDQLKLSVLVGDLETERDAERIRQAGIDSLQIVTGGTCHLEAQMVFQALDHIDLAGVDILFIENVGNLVCPASFDLGEDYRVVLMATTEGDDKPKKYPRMFVTSELLVISKSDLLPYLPFSVAAAVQDARDCNPDIEVLTLSSYKDEGMDEWCQWLLEKVARKKAAAVAQLA